MKVLITSVGSNTSISVVKALRKLNNEVFIVGTDSNPRHLCAGSEWVDKFFTLPTVRKKPDYLEALERIVKKEPINCLIPIHDLEIEVVSEVLDKLNQHCFVATNISSIILLCNDKGATNRIAVEAGLQVPGSFSENNTFAFPLIAKPLKGVSSRGLILITNESDLNSFTKQHQQEEYIVQEFIKGEEYTIDTYSDYKGNFYGGMVRRRIETKAGISTKGVTIDDHLLIPLCKKFLELIEYKGAANLQFIVRDGIAYFIEINPRFSAGGILSYEAGFNSPGFTILEASQEKLPPFESLNLKYNLYMTRYWQEKFHQN